MVKRVARLARVRCALVCVAFALAALSLLNNHRTSLSYLRRDTLRDRFLSFGFLGRMEMESARLSFSEWIVDLRCLRVRGSGFAHSAFARGAV